MLPIPSSLIQRTLREVTTAQQDCTRNSEFSLHKGTEQKAACIFSDKVFSVRCKIEQDKFLDSAATLWDV